MRDIRQYITRKNIRWLLTGLLFAAVVTIIFTSIYLIRVTKDLPSVEVLAEYRPPVMTRVHAGDGRLIAEYATQHRVFVPIESIPKNIQHAFVAAEDQRFYEHSGFDSRGFTRAMVSNIGHVLKNERLEGGSTITQQVAKNFLVGSDRKVSRKIREVVIARRIESALDKDHILELYLNEIYLGERSYGVAAAALNYFGKSLNELDLSETAYLAGIPKGPNNYDLVEHNDRAINRRNYVLSRLVADNYVTQEEADVAKSKALVGVTRLSGEEYLASDYFVEEVRRKVFSMYGEDELYSGGLSIRTSLDTGLQVSARNALRNGLEAYDKRYGYRGPIDHFDSLDDWKDKLDSFDAPADIDNWKVAVVLKADEKQAELGFPKLDEDTDRPKAGKLSLKDMNWARPVNNKGRRGSPPKSVTDVVKPGDVILVSNVPKSDNAYALEQIPEVNGAIIAMDPHTGRILASVGGYSFRQSQFNRATQAYRQPGSAFKPFVYAAALDNGFTPASLVLDAPFVIKRHDNECEVNELGVLELRSNNEDGQDESSSNLAKKDECERFYKPSNYTAGKFYGLSTLRLGLEKSRNAMTVRLASDIGMQPIIENGKRFNIYDDPKPELAWALGAGETTLLRMATAYSELVNGGKGVTPHIIDRVQDGQGKTIFIGSGKHCDICSVDDWNASQPVPELTDDRPEVIDPVTAYQVTYMLQGVITNGTGIIINSLGYPLGGKTGTTNDYKDAWFMGFSPDMVAGVYVGYDTPRTLNNEAGSTAAAPIFKAFMAEALKGKAKVPFRIPEGVTLAPINRTSGEPSYIGAPDFILEAFRPGTEPKLGEVSSTIRIGSGSSFIASADSLNDYINDSINADLDSDSNSESETESDTVRVSPITDSTQTAQNTSDVDPEDGAEDAKLPANDETPPAKQPEDKVEENLDDGLY